MPPATTLRSMDGNKSVPCQQRRAISAVGGKPADMCSLRVLRILTHLRHQCAIFAVVHSGVRAQQCGNVRTEAWEGTLMRRREFITLIGGAASWPLAARAQQATMPVIGFLGGADAIGYAPLIEALRSGLRDHGYIEGRTIEIEYRWAQGRYEHLPAPGCGLGPAQGRYHHHTGDFRSHRRQDRQLAKIPYHVMAMSAIQSRRGS